MSQQSHLIHLAAWAQTQVSPSIIRRIQKAHEGLEAAWNTSTESLISSLNIPDGAAGILRTNKPKIDPEQNWKSLEQKGIHFIDQESPNYPQILKEISSAPLFLFAMGNIEALQTLHKVAIVGTRQVSEYGKRCLDHLVPPLVQNGIAIVSGLAFGVDAYAHEVTLSSGGTAIAVLGCSVDDIYPVANQRLGRAILESNGVILSEYAVGAPPMPQNFPARNRIISGLSKAVVVVEAKQKSGSLITANFALEQGRDVFAVPGSILSENSEGTNHLIEQGATPLSNIDAILESLGLKSAEQSQSHPLELHFESELERSVYTNLKEPLDINDLARQLSLSGHELSQTLTMLELRGIVKNLGTMRYGRS